MPNVLSHMLAIQLLACVRHWCASNCVHPHIYLPWRLGYVIYLMQVLCAQMPCLSETNAVWTGHMSRVLYSLRYKLPTYASYEKTHTHTCSQTLLSGDSLKVHTAYTSAHPLKLAQVCFPCTFA